ncbi:hypothetical protein D3C76_949720 [compost metagenome]
MVDEYLLHTNFRTHEVREVYTIGVTLRVEGVVGRLDSRSSPCATDSHIAVLPRLVRDQLSVVAFRVEEDDATRVEDVDFDSAYHLAYRTSREWASVPADEVRAVQEDLRHVRG